MALRERRVGRHVSASSALAALSAAEAEALLQLPGGARLAIKRWGHGTPILCLHAVGHGSGDFADLAVRVGDTFELIALDWPGMGRSPPDGAPVSAPHFAELLLEAADALDPKRPFVIGNSIGGTAAIIAAAQAPDRFAGLVLCNPGGLSALDAAARFMISRMSAFFRAGVRRAWWFPGAFAAYYRYLVLSRAPARERREVVIRASDALAPLLEQAWEGFGKEAGDIRALAPQLHLPVWLAWAKADRFVSYGRAKGAVATMPHHHLTLFHGGHSAFLEDPTSFAEGLRAFVEDVQMGRFT